MTLEIGNRVFSSKKVFIIAEIGNNHNGDFERAKKMIDMAVEMGADCAKFQMRHLDEVYRARTLKKDGEDLGTEYILDLLNKFELSKDEHRELAKHCEKRGIMYMCTPWDHKSVDVLESFNVLCYKVASADLTNLPLLDRLCKTMKPMILSTGMSREEEIYKTVDFLKSKNTSFALLHCNSTYPAPYHDINLNWMNSLKKIHPVIGYSGHERGTAVSIAALSFGACVIERHFTLDRNMEGPDHAASLEFDEFKKLIEGIRQVEEALGEDGTRQFSQGEMINRENLSKSLVAANDIKEGEIITEQLVMVRSPGQGISPQYYSELIGKKTKRDFKKEDFFFLSDLSEDAVKPRAYSYERSWGVPVRFHDFKWFIERVTPKHIEFHLSYSDLELDPSDYLSGAYDFDFVVHAPELFAGSHLMDLATPDENYRQQSLRETQRVIDITRDLKKFFPKTKKPMIVANIGGFTMDKNLTKEEVENRYRIFAQSLTELDMAGVELIPQTMAPFPWHFGGQRYQNLFVKIEEIVHWCEKLNLRMCFDVSHSMLTSNYLGCDFYDFSKKIAPYTAHLHLGDAKGFNGEGLQVGEGEIDFDKLGQILRDGCPQASFIPEIWQGHKNGGEGFWIALERLESKL